jgi:hypothetical protein
VREITLPDFHLIESIGARFFIFWHLKIIHQEEGAFFKAINDS